MTEVALSEAERTYILHGIEDDCRVDGRGHEDYRTFHLESDLVSNSSGSARVRLANTDVLVGVKAEIGEPEVDKPKEGRLEFFVDCSANATPAFEGRGGEDLATEIAGMMAVAFDNDECLDLKSLSIITGKQCWVLYVDILILEVGGNLYDAVSVAVKAALFNTKIPVVKVSSGERGDAELEISDDPYDCQRLDVSNVPCLVTLNKVGDHHVVDATLEEEACTLARLVVGVTEQGSITAMRKVDAGSFHPQSITDMLQSGRKVGQALQKQLTARLNEEEQIKDSSQSKGFLR